MEETPIEQEEFLFRKFHKNPYLKNPPPPVLPNAFEPRQSDEDGISLYRAICLTPETLSNHGRSPGNSYVAQIQVREIQALGLSVIKTVGDGQLPGHVSIPELSYAAFLDDYPTSREFQAKLAELANQPGAIVFRPSAA